LPPSRLSTILDEREPVWKESGRIFIESVTTLLERLLDYRNALQVRLQDMVVSARVFCFAMQGKKLPKKLKWHPCRRPQVFGREQSFGIAVDN
jgi:hypothetical protein